VIAEAEDVFYLTGPELMATTPGRSLADVVSERMARRSELEQLELPGAWRGRPATKQRSTDAGERAVGVRLHGIGTSPGVVEGPVRVLSDPTFAEVEPGEILVAPLTDPAWAPVMFVSAALVVDIGGLFSHASVVARELGIPCVMGAEKGTQRLRTGDVCRVDGDAGTVEILRLVDDAGAVSVARRQRDE
jgi:pyruvate,water dikinase